MFSFFPTNLISVSSRSSLSCFWTSNILKFQKWISSGRKISSECFCLEIHLGGLLLVKKGKKWLRSAAKLPKWYSYFNDSNYNPENSVCGSIYVLEKNPGVVYECLQWSSYQSYDEKILLSILWCTMTKKHAHGKPLANHGG